MTHNNDRSPKRQPAPISRPWQASTREMSAVSRARAARRQQKWELELHLVEKFISGNGRLPRAGGVDRDAFERRLGTWLRTQRRERERRSDHQRQLLEALPGFAWQPREAHWDRRMSDYREFVSEHHREPSTRSENKYERHLARWVTRQRAARRCGALSTRRAAQLDAFTRPKS
jgi:hypothetical protein